MFESFVATHATSFKRWKYLEFVYTEDEKLVNGKATLLFLQVKTY